MVNLLQAGIGWLRHTNRGTWWGHYLQGLVFFLLGFAADDIMGGFLATVAVFLHREGDNFLKAVEGRGFRLAFRLKGLDGIMDFTTPVLGVGSGLALIFGGLIHFLVTVIVTAGIIEIAAQRDEAD